MAENEIGQFLLRRHYATSCTLQMTLKAAALVIVASGAEKFRMARVGSWEGGEDMVLVPHLVSTVVALHGMGPSWREHLALVCLTWPGQCF